MCRCHFLMTVSSAGAEERDRFLPPGSSSTDGPESVGYFLCVNFLKIVQVTLSINIKKNHAWGEPNSPGFSYFCVWQFMQLYLFWPHFLLFSFTTYFLASHPTLAIQLNRRSEIEAEKGKLHELLHSEIVKTGSITVDSPLLL